VEKEEDWDECRIQAEKVLELRRKDANENRCESSLVLPRRAWRDGDGQLRHQSSLVFATELLGSLASGAWRRDRGGGAGEGREIGGAGGRGGQGGGRVAALTIGFGERGFPHF